MNYIAEITTEMTRWYDILNIEKFGGELLPVIITVQKSRKNNLGHFTTGKIWVSKTGQENRYEINVAAHSLHREVIDIVGTILHEMLHEYNTMNGIRDCNGSVHSKKFKALAEEHGFRVENSKRGGWGHTYVDVGTELYEFIANEIRPDGDLFDYARVVSEEDGEATPPPKAPRKKNIIQYVCPKCEATAKAKIGTELMCGKCKEDMEPKED